MITTRTQPLAVVVGFAGKLPLAGMALANLHIIAGLEDLGYRVHYVERQNGPGNLYDPANDRMTDDPGPALRFLGEVLPRYCKRTTSHSFIDLQGNCHGTGWRRLRDLLTSADFVLDLGDATWFDELALCPRRGFIDVDPMFTQIQILTGEGRKAETTPHYDTAFTHALRMGMPDCSVPAAGRRWIPARTAVATRLWAADAAGANRPLTALMNWSSGSELSYQGRTYGYKDREFVLFESLPQRTSRRCLLAAGGGAPKKRLRELGWELTSPLAVTATIDAYRDFIAESAADFGVAKHAYVQSRCGWFSDRSTCYMAAGRPVLHQDTGIADWLPTGEGVLLFSTLEEALDGLRRLELDYPRHAEAARALAEEHFEAATVLGAMLRDAGWS